MIVYLITNKINSKKYVGWTSLSLKRRWFLHCNRKNCKALRGAIDKYGVDNFVVEAIFTPSTKEEAGKLEIENIKFYNTKAPHGYNLTDGGEGVRGLPDDVRLRRNKALLGNKNALGAVRTPEYCKQKSDSQIGRIFSDEARRKMSESASRKIVSQETKNKKSEISKRLGLRPPVLSKEQLAEAGRISGHKRYHVRRNIINPNCRLCKEQ